MNLGDVFSLGFVILGIYKTFELFVRKKERLAIVEKLTSLANFESPGPIRLPNILYEKQDFGSWPLRISLLLMGLGLGYLCAFFLEMHYQISLNDKDYWGQKRMIESAAALFFGGIGLFIAFLIELKQKNSQSNGDNR